MDVPVNAVYGKKQAANQQRKPVPNPTQPVMIAGYAFPREQVRKVMMAVVGFAVVVTVVILVYMPTGIPYLAAKNASGLLGYIGLFFLYMLGFFLFLVLLGAAGIGILMAIRKYA